MPHTPDGSTMRRRQFVTTASATIATASIAGCSGILGGGGGGSSGPEAAVEGYFEAGQSGDTEEMQEYVHPDGELTDATATGGSDGEEVSLESTEVLEENEDRATVTAEIEVSGEMNGEEQSVTFTYEFDVRKHDGEWKVYAFTTTGSSSN